MLQTMALLEGFDIGGDGPDGRTLRPYRGRMPQARLRRPRGLLRRSRTSPTCRSTRCCPRTTPPNAASWSARRRRWNCAPGSLPGFDRPAPDYAAAEARSEMGYARGRRGRADGRAPRRLGRRHLPRRRDRQPGQHGQRDALGRLAAILPGDPGARLLPRHARADVLAGREPAERPEAGQAAAHDALARHGAARRAPLDELRHAGRRAAGPVAADHVRPHGGPRHGHPAGDRRAVLPHRALALAASGRARAKPGKVVLEGPLHPRRARWRCATVATWWRSAASGRRAG